jgi:restriction system protein
LNRGSSEFLHISDSPPKSELTQDLPVVALGVELIETGGRVPEGRWVLAVTPAWVQILEALGRDPDVFHKLTWWQWQQLIAGGYEKHGFKVIIGPRSNDGGKDIIATATREDVGTIRILDQVKHYKPGHLVTAAQVREMWGVLDRNPSASKACISTTSDFAPGAYKEFADVMSTRIELRNGQHLKEWLTAAAIAKK